MKNTLLILLIILSFTARSQRMILFDIGDTVVLKTGSGEEGTYNHVFIGADINRHVSKLLKREHIFTNMGYVLVAENGAGIYRIVLPDALEDGEVSMD